MSGDEPRVSVVVSFFNDVDRIAEAIRSALAQGEVVGEVLVVDGVGTDTTPALLSQLAAADPRLRVITGTTDRGGCGTPRNEGIAAAREPYVMLLNSNDVLPPDAARSLLDAATTHRADIVAGVTLRRELPSRAETPWQRKLYPADGAPPVVYPEGIGPRTDFLHDTLSAGKLYDRAFLERNAVHFADGDALHEDFVSTATVYAARPRLVAIADPVYIWHTRRQSKSPRHNEIRNWRDRVDAHAEAVTILEQAGEKDLAAAAGTKFLDYDLQMSIRELAAMPADHQAEWWSITRDYLCDYDPGVIAAAKPTARWITSAILASDEPGPPSSRWMRWIWSGRRARPSR